MPFKSDKQRRYLYAEKPKVAKKFAMDKLKVGGRTDAGPNRTTASHATKGQINEKGQTVGGGQTTRDGDGSKTKTPPKTTTPDDRPFYNPVNIPTIGPASWALDKVVNYIGPKAYDSNKKKRDKFATKEGLFRDHYKVTGTKFETMDPKNKGTLKEAGYGPFNKDEEPKGDNGGPQLCPDGTNPPCKVPTVTKKTVTEPLVKKKQIFDNFKAYKKGKMIKKNKGGGVPYGPPPLRGPNPQVPPVKFSRGGGSALKGTKFKGVF